MDGRFDDRDFEPGEDGTDAQCVSEESRPDEIQGECYEKEPDPT